MTGGGGEAAGGAPGLEPQDSPSHPMAPWFADIRAERRQARAAAPRRGLRRRPRTRAVVTIVHNEPVFLPIWLRYYGRFFGPDDMYVLDNETTDGSTSGSGFVRIPVERGEVDHTWMVRTMEAVQHDLLTRYDMVLVCDVDELVAPVPELGTLGDYLDGFAEPWVNCVGYELLHLRDREPPLDLSRPILDQRGHWYFNGAYDKAALATEPMRWRPGFHGREDMHYRLDPDLRLIHLHRMDYDLCLERHRTRSRRPWAPHDAQHGWAAHNRITDEAEFARWFETDSSVEWVTIAPEPIRPNWRGVF